MKKYALWFLVAMMFIAAVTAGCGGGGSDDPEQSEQFTDDTDSYDPNVGGRGMSDTEPTDLSKITANYTASNGETLTGTLGARVKISVAHGATVTLKDVTINGRHEYKSYKWAGITCEGNATLILEGSNYVRGFHQEYAGIYVPTGRTLTIKGTGSLTASNNTSNGCVDGYGAGIGAGYNIPCGNIVIEGGIINAVGGSYAAGIGGSYRGNFDSITITGGEVTATSLLEGAGIGGGRECSRGNITITDSVYKVTATKGSNALHSIGSGYKGWGVTVKIGDNVGPIEQSPYPYEGKGKPIDTPPEQTEEQVQDLSTISSNYTAHDGEILTGALVKKVKISIADGATVTLRDATIHGSNNSKYTWSGLTCEGNATIILEGTNSVRGFYEIYPGIYVPENKTLTIKGNGSLNARGCKTAGAGIGGSPELPCGNIVIDGGTITAIGGHYAAGIGSSVNGICGDITINGGTVTATGYDSAGIGSAQNGTCGNITINGGTVTATGYDSAGIGSAQSSTCGNITINGGTVTATGGESAAGIGSAQSSTCGKITISDKVTKVTAIGGYYAQCSIGAGYYGSSGTITIGGQVTGPVKGQLSEDGTYIYTYP